MSIVTPTMAGFKKIEMIRVYCDYVQEHLQNVAKAWATMQERCKHEKFIWDDYDFWHTHQMIELHDMSKFSSEEFIQYAEYFHTEYGREWDSFDTGNAAKHEEAMDAFAVAWSHHKASNMHHWESFPDDGWALHAVCMIVDWMAMGMKFGDTALEYYENNKEKIELQPNVREYVERLLRQVCD